MAPSRMASNSPLQQAEGALGQAHAGPQVPLGAPVEGRQPDLLARRLRHRLEGLDRLRHDLDADAVARDQGDAQCAHAGRARPVDAPAVARDTSPGSRLPQSLATSTAEGSRPGTLDWCHSSLSAVEGDADDRGQGSRAGQRLAQTRRPGRAPRGRPARGRRRRASSSRGCGPRGASVGAGGREEDQARPEGHGAPERAGDRPRQLGKGRIIQPRTRVASTKAPKALRPNAHARAGRRAAGWRTPPTPAPRTG